MGIDNFHKMIRENYAGSFKRKWSQCYDHVYVDINYALHYCSHKAQTEQEVLDRLHVFFDNIFQETVPIKTINVCTDGVAPLAKLILQRKRRLGTSRNLENNEGFSSLSFTPGTVFMTKLKDNLKKYFEYIENTYHVDVNYLDHEIDEAELKLKHKLMCNINDYENNSHIVVTNDADMIVMLTTLEQKDLHNIFVFCKNNTQNEVLSIGKMLDLHTNKFGMSINYNLDFTFVSLLMGNDYLPKVSLADFNKLWKAYSEICSTNLNGLVNNKLEVNWNFFAKILNRIMTLSKNQFIKRVTKTNTFTKLHENYFDGLTWCLDTYYTGKCIRYDYMYEYNTGPHPLGLLMSLQFNKNLLCHNKNICKPISSSLYAILVLPNLARNLIDKKYHKFMDDSDILYSVENCKKCIDFHSNLKTLNGDLLCCDEDNENEKNNIKKKISNISKEMVSHKKKHENLSLRDIKTISLNFDKYCKKNKL